MYTITNKSITIKSLQLCYLVSFFKENVHTKQPLLNHTLFAEFQDCHCLQQEVSMQTEYRSFYLWKMKVANELHTPSFHDQPTQTPKKLHMMCQHLPQIREKHVQERPGHFLYLISYIAFNICQYLKSFLTQNSSLKSDFGISPEYQTDGHRSVYDLRGVSEFLENSQAVLKQMLQIGTIHTLTQICTSKRLKTQVLIYFKQ